MKHVSRVLLIELKRRLCRTNHPLTWGPLGRKEMEVLVCPRLAYPLFHDNTSGAASSAVKSAASPLPNKNDSAIHTMPLAAQSLPHELSARN